MCWWTQSYGFMIMRVMLYRKRGVWQVSCYALLFVTLQYLWFHCLSHIKLIMDFFSNVWNVGYLGDIRLLESVQRRWSTEIADVSLLAYVERLKVLNLFSIFGHLVRADLIKCWKVFNSEVDVGLLDGFTVAVDRRTHGHSLKIVVPRCVLEMRLFGMYGLFSGGIHYLSLLLHNLHYLPLRGSWIRSWVICCTQCCSSLNLFFF